jgi:hypothetical protein
MPKYNCTVKAYITETYEVEEVLEIDAPDEVQAEEDALTAAEHASLDMWLKNPAAKAYVDFDTYFEVDEVEEKPVEYSD